MSPEISSITQLRERVAFAFEHRKQDRLEPGNNSTTSQIERSRQQRAYLESPELIPPVNSDEYVEEIHSVTVEQAEHLPLLLKLVSELFQQQGYDPLTTSRIDELIEHEFQHVAVIKKPHNFKIRYGVQFYQFDTGIGYNPFISVYGDINLELYDAIISAPHIKSTADLI